MPRSTQPLRPAPSPDYSAPLPGPGEEGQSLGMGPGGTMGLREQRLWREEEEAEGQSQHGSGGTEFASGSTGGDAIDQVG